MDFPDIVNIYVCKFVLVVFFVWLCDKSAFMLIRIQFCDVLGIDGLYLERGRRALSFSF